MTAYLWKRAGRSYQDRQLFRQKILSAKKEDVANAVKELIAPSHHLTVSLLGEELFKKEQKQLKEVLEVLPI